MTEVRSLSIDEAIKILKHDIDYPGSMDIQDVAKAEMLGIEALKRCKTLVENNPLWAAKPLPGETKE